jgi:hypothetical protein
VYSRPETRASTRISNTTQKGPTFKAIYQEPIFKPIHQNAVVQAIGQDPVFKPIAARPAENQINNTDITRTNYKLFHNPSVKKAAEDKYKFSTDEGKKEFETEHEARTYERLLKSKRIEKEKIIRSLKI